MKNTLSRDERLRSRIAFEALIKDGTVYFSYPLRITWKISKTPQQKPVQIAFAVPKKRFKQAVKRNRIKRLLREAFRLNKHPLYEFLETKQIQLHFLIVYIGDEILSFDELEKKMQQFFLKLTNQINQKDNNQLL